MLKHDSEKTLILLGLYDHNGTKKENMAKKSLSTRVNYPSLTANSIAAIMRALEAVSSFYDPVSTPSLNLGKKRFPQRTHTSNPLLNE